MSGRTSRSCRAPETPAPLSPFIFLTVSFHLSVSSFVFSYAASRSTLSCSRGGRGAEMGPARFRADVDPVGAAKFDSAVAARGFKVFRRLASRGFFESAKDERRSSSWTRSVSGKRKRGQYKLWCEMYWKRKKGELTVCQ